MENAKGGCFIPKQEFKATLVKPDAPGTWTYLVAPFKVEEIFGSKAQVKVKGTINGVPYRSSLMPASDGTHYMVVQKALRDKAGITRGSMAHVVMDIDTKPRVVETPPELENALGLSEEAGSVFGKLSYSHKKEYVDWITSAKKEETKLRRVQKAISMLEEGKRLK